MLIKIDRMRNEETVGIVYLFILKEDVHMLSTKEAKKVVAIFKDRMEISDEYEVGKKDVEYMTQNAFTLASFSYGGYAIEITVNGDVRFDHEDATYRYEDDLTDDIVELLRKGEIELDNNNWFEFFSTDSFDVAGIDTLPTKNEMKALLIDQMIDEMENDGDPVFESSMTQMTLLHLGRFLP